MKLQAPDGKLRLTDVLDNEGIMLLARNFPNNKAADFLDWSLINKNDYLAAMTQSAVDSSRIKQLISNALTDKIEDREVFMKGIDYFFLCFYFYVFHLGTHRLRSHVCLIKKREFNKQVQNY